MGNLWAVSQPSVQKTIPSEETVVRSSGAPQPTQNPLINSCFSFVADKRAVISLSTLSR